MPASPFSKRQIAITMSGAEWVALIARVIDKPLSEAGVRVYEQAQKKMIKQLRAASKAEEIA
jgi:hypothetical protein